MTHQPHETLDESIDRVAASLTAVPADPAFSTRLGARLAQPSSQRASLLFVVSAVAVALVAAVVTGVFSRPEPTVESGSVVPRDVRRPENAAVVVERDAFGRDNPIESGQEGGMPMQPPTASSRRPESATTERVTPMIAALPTLELLSVDTLMLETLAIAPVEVDLLDVATLEVPEIEGSSDPKE